MTTIDVKRGDTIPTVDATLTTTDGPIDLTTATSVRFHMGTADAILIDAAATITSAAAGEVRYAWQPGDTDTAGVYRLEWEITWPDGIQTIPSDSYDTVHIRADLR